MQKVDSNKSQIMINVKKLTGIILLTFVLVMAGCATNNQNNKGNDETNWKDALDNKLPLLGHRNWILVVDKAFPLQTGQGIEVVYTGKELLPVLSHVLSEV